MEKSHGGDHEYRDHMVEVNVVEKSIEKFTWEEMVVAIKSIEPEKATDLLKYVQRRYVPVEK